MVGEAVQLLTQIDLVQNTNSSGSC